MAILWLTSSYMACPRVLSQIQSKMPTTMTPNFSLQNSSPQNSAWRHGGFPVIECRLMKVKVLKWNNYNIMNAFHVKFGGNTKCFWGLTLAGELHFENLCSKWSRPFSLYCLTVSDTTCLEMVQNCMFWVWIVKELCSGCLYVLGSLRLQVFLRG